MRNAHVCSGVYPSRKPTLVWEQWTKLSFWMLLNCSRSYWLGAGWRNRPKLPSFASPSLCWALWSLKFAQQSTFWIYYLSKAKSTTLLIVHFMCSLLQKNYCLYVISWFTLASIKKVRCLPNDVGNHNRFKYFIIIYFVRSTIISQQSLHLNRKVNINVAAHNHKQYQLSIACFILDLRATM